MPSWIQQHKVQLSQEILAGRLPHALLINGGTGAGKQLLVDWLVRALHCKQVEQEPIDANKVDAAGVIKPCGNCQSCHLLQSDNCPDHISVRSEKNTLGVDAIRAVTLFLEKTAQLSHLQTVTVNPADSMTVAASNALLKTLEEPTPASYLILVTHDASLMLPTIISRCRKYDIRPPQGRKLQELISKGEVGASQYVNLSHLPELQSADNAELYTIFEGALIDFLLKPEAEEKLAFKLAFEHAENSIRWLEKVLVNLMRHYYGWMGVFNENNSIDKSPKLVKAKQINKGALWGTYQLVVKYAERVKNIPQLSASLQKEQLINDMYMIIRPSYEAGV